ncbi:ABC transporter permease [Paenibacillus sacheonensis]|uniref:ABC transporter permease subunit n=1 Tax=Paenibacillus sacheonensis TaxID=742054 RepID=A0A7X5C1D3_9BACL|nr:ABC transporter permease subunit [Paenibacillus sacheonensis]MBM7565076.1 putative aldouronate transport system permease protein [Paenibacillus sacheonensis]NBC70140.1 ABC transporter permease subunit [Paenibacillus sacheonensis]
MRRRTIRELPFHLMILPGFLLVLIYSYVPMAGIVMAFERLVPSKGMFMSPWVGWKNFEYMLRLPGTLDVLRNTFFIAGMKMAAGIIVPVSFALLLNEARQRLFRRSIQTIIYFPHFLSWIILSGILIDILSPSTGIVNGLLGVFKIPPAYFLGDSRWFPFTLVLTDTWKEFGYGTIVYLAALTGINPALYEAAAMDGAGRLRQTINVTLPALLPMIVLMSVLSLGNILNAGFEQVFNLYSPQVYKTGDIIDTLVFRIGLENANYGVATAVGLFKSVVSFVMVGLSYLLAYRLTDYRIF